MRVTTAQFAVVVVSLLGLTGCKVSNPFAKKDAASSTALANAPAYKPGNTGANSAANQRPSANATASTIGGPNSGTAGYKVSPNYGAPSGGSSSSYPIATNNTSYGAPPTGGATPGYQQPVTPASYDNQYPKTGFAAAHNAGTTPGSASMTNPYTQPAAGAAGAQVGHYDAKGYNAGSGYGQPPAAGNSLGRDPYQSNSANSYVTGGADAYKPGAPTNPAAGMPDYRTADVSKPYTGATRTDYGTGPAAGSNATGGSVPSFGSDDPYLTQGDPFTNSLQSAGKSAELPNKPAGIAPTATTPKNDYNPGATGYNAGATGYNAGATGYNAGNTGYGSGMTGYGSGATGYNAGNTGYNAPPSYTPGANGSTPAATGSSPYRPGGTSDFKPAGGGVTPPPANGSWNNGASATGAGSYNPPANSYPASSAPATTPNAQFGGGAAAGYGNGF